MEQARLQFIGVLHGDITNREDAPKNFDESERVGTLEIYPNALSLQVAHFLCITCKTIASPADSKQRTAARVNAAA